MTKEQAERTARMVAALHGWCIVCKYEHRCEKDAGFHPPKRTWCSRHKQVIMQRGYER